VLVALPDLEVEKLIDIAASYSPKRHLLDFRIFKMEHPELLAWLDDSTHYSTLKANAGN